MTLTDWAPIVVAVIAAIPGILAWMRQQRKEKAETADVLTTAAERLVKGFRDAQERDEKRITDLEDADERSRDRIDILEQDNRDLRKRLMDCIAGIRMLLAQLREHNITPAWEPAPDALTRLE